jgi:hypothetical protein
MLAAALLMRSGIPASEAVDVVTKAREIAVPETSAQFEWLQDLASECLLLM